jgi:hypothetical protein
VEGCDRVLAEVWDLESATLDGLFGPGYVSSKNLMMNLERRQ